MTKGKPIFFDDILGTFSKDSFGKGIAFEHLVKWWLKNDPYWKTELKPNSILLWSESPHRVGRDIGIDLTAEDFLGNVWAIQAKNWNEKTSLPKSEIDKFLSASNIHRFQKRLLITTTSSISSNAALAMEQQEKEVKKVTITDLRESNIDWGAFLERPNEVAAKPPKELFPHQKAALLHTVEGLKKYKKGQLVMACGTGKTLTAQRINENLNSKITLVLVPSLLLVQQTLKAWKNESREPFLSLAVCSDDSVNSDLSLGKVKDLFLTTTTDSKIIKKFLNLKGKKVIVSTYQSSSKVADALKGTKVKFDLIIADEAHRLSGTVDDEYGSVLKPNRLPSKHLLFMTATPRIFTTRVKKIAASRGVEVFSMNDEETFGPVLHTYSFADAIAENVLTDYRVVIVGVEDNSIQEMIKDREFVRAADVDIDARTLASHVSLAKSMNELNLQKVISFHSRVVSARKFAEDHHKIRNWIKGDSESEQKFESFSISGKDSADYRKRILDKLKNDNNFQQLLTNARCLTEGVDVPTLDGIAFIDPRASQVDIVQAVGRAIRRGGEAKKFGYILIPLFFTGSNLKQETIDESAFKPVWDVINALKSHDTLLAEEIDNLRINLGEQKNSKDIGDKISINLPITLSDDFVKKIYVQIVEKTSSDWYESFGELKEIIESSGGLAASKHLQSNKYLANWIIHQRQNYFDNKLEQKRITLLENLPGWTWNPLEDAWTTGLRQLQKYFDRYGDAKPPISFIDEDEFPLGRWVSKQRDKESKLSTKRKNQLETIPGWVWNPHQHAWTQGYKALEAFNKKHGHCKVPKSEIYSNDKLKLLNWVKKQRGEKNLLTERQIELLEKLKGWSWSPFDDQWMIGISELKRYVEEFGDSKVPSKFVTKSKFKLGNWVVQARAKEETLSSEWKVFLEALPGWTWNSKKSDWRNAYEALIEYTNEHNKIPPRDYRTISDIPLGRWVKNQREKYNSGVITEEEIVLLEKIDNWSWDVFADAWNEKFAEVQDFVVKTGRLPKDKEKSANGIGIGSWVTSQRKNRSKLTKIQKQKLQSLTNWRW